MEKQEEDDPIIWAFEALSENGNKAVALQNIKIGRKIIDSAIDRKVDTDEPIPEIWEWKAGAYHIAAMVYLWNGLYSEAYHIEPYIFYSSFVEKYPKAISDYLVFLIIFGQKEHLEEIFSNPAMKKDFLPAWETYMSLMVDPKTEITRIYETVPLINQVQAGIRLYIGNK